MVDLAKGGACSEVWARLASRTRNRCLKTGYYRRSRDHTRSRKLGQGRSTLQKTVMTILVKSSHGRFRPSRTRPSRCRFRNSALTQDRERNPWQWLLREPAIPESVAGRVLPHWPRIGARWQATADPVGPDDQRQGPLGDPSEGEVAGRCSAGALLYKMVPVRGRRPVRTDTSTRQAVDVPGNRCRKANGSSARSRRRTGRQHHGEQTACRRSVSQGTQL